MAAITDRATLIARLRNESGVGAANDNDRIALMDEAADALAQSERERDEAQAEAKRYRAKYRHEFTENVRITQQITEQAATIAAVRARLQVPMHPYGDKRIPKMPEVQFARDAYGPDLFDDLDAILSRSTPTAEAVKLDPEPSKYSISLSLRDERSIVDAVVDMAAAAFLKNKSEKGGN